MDRIEIETMRLSKWYSDCLTRRASETSCHWQAPSKPIVTSQMWSGLADATGSLAKSSITFAVKIVRWSSDIDFIEIEGINKYNLPPMRTGSKYAPVLSPIPLCFNGRDVHFNLAPKLPEHLIAIPIDSHYPVVEGVMFKFGISLRP